MTEQSPLLSAVPIPKASARTRKRVILTGGVPSRPDQRGSRLPFPYPLPRRDGALPLRRAGLGRGAAQALDRLPLGTTPA